MADSLGTVLVVDDDQDVALVCCLHLEAAGFEVEHVGSAGAAMEAIERHRPDVVLLDYMLPDFDGVEVTRRLRGDRATAGVPVVMLTARTDDQDQVAAWEAGVSDYLTKPFEGAKLVAIVHQAITRSARDEVERRQEAMRSLRGGEAERRAHLATIVEESSDAVIGKSLDGEITYWNRAAARLYGWAEDEVLGSSISLITAPEHTDETFQLLEQVRMGQVIEAFETVRVHRDGRRIQVSLSVSPVRDAEGRVVGVATIARDVTDRLQMQARFRSLIEAAPDAMVIVDADGHIELVNRQTEVLFGHSREDLLGQPVEILIPHHFRARHPECRRRYADRPRTREMGAGLELSGLRADGTQFPVEISLSPLDDDEGLSYAATIRDVTERKSADARFKGLLEAAPDAMVIVGPDGRITLINAATERLFGYRREELVGQQVEILVPDGFRPSHPTLRRKYGADEHVRQAAHGRNLDLAARRRDGTAFPAEISLSSIETEEGRLVSAAIRDVTERKLAEERFRGLVEAAPDAMVIVDADGRISLVNAQTVKMFGYEREELVGRPVEVLVPTRYRDRHPKHREGYGSSPRVRPMGAGHDLCGMRKDGSEFPVEISLSPLETDQGVTISASIRDITVRRRAEEAQALAFEREKEATARLREVDRLRNDFLSTVSHELRTPLTAIKGFAEFLTGSWHDIPDDRREEMVARILAAGGRLDFLIQDLLDFSRLERGRLKVNLVPTCLADVVRETVEHAGPALEGHEVVCDLDEDATVQADRNALMRVVENLLTNAAKFSPQGSTIHVTTETDDDRVVLSVRDEGIGIPEHEHEKVFDRFYRVPDTAVSHPGTGIGLAIVKHFVEAQRGRVDVVSSLGGGAEFRVRLSSGR